MSQFPFRFGPSTCCCEPLDCVYCDTDTTPSSVIITLRKVKDGVCSCTILDGSYELTQDEEDGCVYTYSADVTLSGSDPACGVYTLWIQASVVQFLPSTYWNVFVRLYQGATLHLSWTFRGPSVSASTIDCSQDHFNRTLAFSGGSPPCSYDVGDLPEVDIEPQA